MSNQINQAESSALILRAFILDNQIETSDQVLVVDGEKHSLFSEVLRGNPDHLQQLIDERAEVYQQLGWAVPL
jgi:hypothetical protein